MKRIAELEKHESAFGVHAMVDWSPAIALCSKIIDDNSDNPDAYIRVIYFIHNVLLEEEYPLADHEPTAALLQLYFTESFSKFLNNAEYLFFVGKILYIAEWYFGLNDDDTPLQERLAYKMQMKAFQMEKDNALYHWAVLFSNGDPSAASKATKILSSMPDVVSYLNSKGFPGQYVLDSIKYSSRNISK